jgi:hypothetical protein
MGYQYSDESDSDHRRSDEESLQDHRESASDRSHSKGWFLTIFISCVFFDQVHRSHLSWGWLYERDSTNPPDTRFFILSKKYAEHPLTQKLIEQ